MQITKIIARNIIFPIAVGLGLEKLLSSFGEKKTINLIFHGVVNQDSTYYCPRHIEIKQFEKLIKYFKNNFQIISLDQAFEWKAKGIKPKKNTLTISFDDGYKNNLTTALPLLEKYKIPTTFCISGVCLQHEIYPMLWHDVIDGMDYFFKSETYIFDNHEIHNFIDTKSGKHIYDIVKEVEADTRDRELKRLIEENKLMEKFETMPEEIWKLMNSAELEELSKSNVVTISSHGHYHYNLGLIDVKKATEDMHHSKVLIESIIGKTIDMFAYPDGHYTKEIKEIAADLGFSKQLAVPFYFEEDKNDSRILCRNGISSTTTYASNVFFLNNSFRK